MTKDSNLRYIPLTNGGFAIVDYSDYHLLSSIKWYNSNGYAISHDLVKMHRLIMQPTKEQLIDHIDRNKLNNSRSNLRIVTREGNVHNQKKRENTKNNYKGVQFIKKLNLYQSRCRMNGSDYFLGHYTSEKAAAHAYNVKAKSLSPYVLLNELADPIEALESMVNNDRVTIIPAERESRHKYIYWHKGHKKWIVVITRNNRRKYLGDFKLEQDALIARDNYFTAKPQTLFSFPDPA